MVVIIVVVFLNFLNPSGRSGYLVEVEHVGIQYLVEFHIAIVTVDDFCLGVEGTDDFSDAVQCGRGDRCGLVY